MTIFEILNLLGSLGLFLYGMKVMSDSLMDLTGNRLRKIMIRLTSNRVKGVFTGVVITGMIQSSSLTTLMVVSFVNAQLLSLTEAISVIMGANIGTTFTAWLISILGFKVKMSTIVLPLIVFGLFFYLKKDRKLNNFGNFIIGFSLLFIGLGFMKGALEGFEVNPLFFEFLQETSKKGVLGILLFVGIGTLLTLILQSSSASMAIVMVAASQGLLSFEGASALVLGENIGTTITANLAAMVSSTDARRTAFAHFLFNVIGVLWILLLFQPFLMMIDQFSTQFLGVSPMLYSKDIPIGISIFHTLFNVLNTFVLIWFVYRISKLVIRLMPERAKAEPVFSVPEFLDKRALSYPETAINALFMETRRLYRKAIFEAIAHSMGVHRSDINSDKPAEEIVKNKDRSTIEHDVFIENRIKPIYSEALRFASEIQEKFQLSTRDNNKVTRLKKILRNAQDILVNVKTLQEELKRHQKKKGEVLEEQFLKLQVFLIELLRMFLSEDVVRTPGSKKEQLEKLKNLIKRKDISLLEGLDSLIRKKKITPEEGVSLMTASAAVTRINKALLKNGEYLISKGPKYELMEKIEEFE